MQGLEGIREPFDGRTFGERAVGRTVAMKDIAGMAVFVGEHFGHRSGGLDQVLNTPLNTIVFQAIDEHLTMGIGRKGTHESGIYTQTRKGDGHVVRRATDEASWRPSE